MRIKAVAGRKDGGRFLSLDLPSCREYINSVHRFWARRGPEPIQLSYTPGPALDAITACGRLHVNQWLDRLETGVGFMTERPEESSDPQWIGNSGLSKERAAVVTAKAILFLHHINVLREVHKHQDNWGGTVVAGFEHWASTSVRPWIEADEDLRTIWKIFEASDQEIGGAFVSWLRKILPIA